jgi:hypothetical protein
MEGYGERESEGADGARRLCRFCARRLRRI